MRLEMVKPSLNGKQPLRPYRMSCRVCVTNKTFLELTRLATVHGVTVDAILTRVVDTAGMHGELGRLVDQSQADYARQRQER